MSKVNAQHSRKIWQPLNRRSQVLATIAVLSIAAFQLYSWNIRSTQALSSQLQPAQPLPESKK